MQTSARRSASEETLRPRRHRLRRALRRALRRGGALTEPQRADAAATVEVLPDVSGIDRAFHYSVPAHLAGRVTIGSLVRVPLAGRKVRGFVVEMGTPVPKGVRIVPLVAALSAGPPADVVELCGWAARRYAGRLRPFLAAASPAVLVRPGNRSAAPTGATPGSPPADRSSLATAAHEALVAGDAILRLPPAAPRLDAVLELLSQVAEREGDALILAESRSDAETLARRLESRAYHVALYPDDWAATAAGGTVTIGTRNVVLAPGRRSVIVLLDAHSEAYKSERAPTFDARVIAAERARRERVPVVFVTPCPSLELAGARPTVTLERSAERAGWPYVAVLDARQEDPHEGGYPPALVDHVRRALNEQPEKQVVLVLNRTGRARLLSCNACRSIQRCEACGAALTQQDRPAKGEVGTLGCPRCGRTVPALCSECGGAKLRIVRAGVSRAREQLTALLGVEVGEVGAATKSIPETAVLVGTEAVLHRVRGAGMVGFLDFDNELLAARLRASEQAFVLLARAARMVGDRRSPGRVVVRTSLPEHEVVRAAGLGDPSVLAAVEAPRRSLLALPPASALAVVTGDGAEEALARLGEGAAAARTGEGTYLVRARDNEALADALAAIIDGEPNGWAGVDARIEVDPLDV